MYRRRKLWYATIVAAALGATGAPKSRSPKSNWWNDKLSQSDAH